MRSAGWAVTGLTEAERCTQMLMDLGPNVYQEDFERAFLQEAAEFYQVGPASSLPLLCLCSVGACVGHSQSCHNRGSMRGLSCTPAYQSGGVGARIFN